MDLTVQHPLSTSANSSRNDATNMNIKQSFLLAFIDTDQWASALKDNLHQCWLHFYGPVFWIVSALCCVWESHHREKYRATVDTLVYSATDDEDENTYASWEAASSCSDSYHASRPSATSSNTSSTMSLQTISDHVALPSDTGIPQKMPLRRTILQSIKKKQHSINEAMKRSFSRKNTNKNKSCSPDIGPTNTTSSFKIRQPRLFQKDDNGRRLSMSESLFRSLSLNKTPKQPYTQPAPLGSWDHSPMSHSFDENSLESHHHPFDPPEPRLKRSTKIGMSWLHAESPSLIPFRRKTAPELKIE